MTDPADYFKTTGRPDRFAGGVRMIPIDTPAGPFRVWTKRIGNAPGRRLLFLHGGPGATHEYFEAADSFLPAAGIEYVYYDQLGSVYSDQPTGHPELWDLDRFVDELEQVRIALELDRDDWFLLGHSWGGILAMEYAVRHGEHLKGLVISNMMSSCPAYDAYAQQVLKPTMDPAVVAEIERLEAAGETEDEHYESLLVANHYVQHVLRMPAEEWPDPVLRGFRLNRELYVSMQGPSELGLSGKLAGWDRSGDLGSITVPTLVIGAAHDTMDPAHMAWMATQLPNGRYLHCPDGSHMAMYDDQERYFTGLVDFIHEVDAGA